MKGNKMRLEYKNQIENSFKFWEIKIDAKKSNVVIKYGRIGINNPPQKENKFTSEEAAKKYAEKKIREKIGKGYVQVK